MSLGVNTNVNAAISILALQQNELDMSRAMQRLSTGKRINSAQDDAAGLAVWIKSSDTECPTGCFHGGSSGGRNCRNIEHVTSNA